MNHSPNSTNKLYLASTIYPGDTVESWYLPQADVDQMLGSGLVPEVVLPRLKQGTCPKIAVMLNRARHPDRNLRDYSMPQRYVDAVCLSGGYPQFIIFEKVAEQLAQIRPDGILLTGGDFAFCSDWMAEETPAHAADEMRFKAYITALEYAHANALPVLGICAGMQMLGGFCGAKMTRIEGHRGQVNNYAHAIDIAADSLLQTISGSPQVMVNSNHSEALSPKHLGDCIITALAEDKTIEAIELKHPWHQFVLGIQAHPEQFVKKGDIFAKHLFQSFVKACKND